MGEQVLFDLLAKTVIDGDVWRCIVIETTARDLVDAGVDPVKAI